MPVVKGSKIELFYGRFDLISKPLSVILVSRKVWLHSVHKVPTA